MELVKRWSEIGGGTGGLNASQDKQTRNDRRDFGFRAKILYEGRVGIIEMPSHLFKLPATLRSAQ